MSRQLIFLIGTLLFLPFFSYSQALNQVDIRLKVIEKIADQSRPLANAKLAIKDWGEAFTDDQGRYNFKYTVSKNGDPGLSIALLSGDHKLLKPLDGAIEVDTSREEVSIELLVVNMAEESEAFKKRVADLETRIARLQARNALTQKQLNEVNNRLLDTILYFEAVREKLANQIVEYKNETEEQQREMDAQRARIADLENQVSRLTGDLEAALEERYLRQNQYFKDISSNLFAYLRKAKDIRDHLPYINTYFSSAGGYANLGRDIQGYNEQWETFDNRRLDYLEGVEHYWENRSVSKEVENLFDFLGKSIHQDQMLPAMNEIIAELHEQKPKKAQKIADMAYENMLANLGELEKRINRTLSNLRKSL